MGHWWLDNNKNKTKNRIFPRLTWTKTIFHRWAEAETGTVLSHQNQKGNEKIEISWIADCYNCSSVARVNELFSLCFSGSTNWTISIIQSPCCHLAIGFIWPYRWDEISSLIVKSRNEECWIVGFGWRVRAFCILFISLSPGFATSLPIALLPCDADHLSLARSLYPKSSTGPPFSPRQLSRQWYWGITW